MLCKNAGGFVTWVVERVLVILGNCLAFLNGLECIMLSSHLK